MSTLLYFYFLNKFDKISGSQNSEAFCFGVGFVLLCFGGFFSILFFSFSLVWCGVVWFGLLSCGISCSCFVVALHPSNMLVYLRDGSAETLLSHTVTVY